MPTIRTNMHWHWYGKYGCFTRLQTFGGPIPYASAGQGLETTPYESQKDVYYYMFDDLETAADIMETSLASNSEENAFGTSDMIYDGSVKKWLSMFPISVEAFAEYRRTRYPKIYPKEMSTNSNINLSKGQIITRLPFVEDEYDSNAEEVAKAIEMIGGSDLENVPVWWDTNSNGN